MPLDEVNQKQLSEINTLKINFMEISKDISYIKDALNENKKQHSDIISENKQQNERILSKIDHFGDTLQDKIQDKADQKEVMTKFNEISEKYVSVESFRPIQKIAYSLVGTILTTIAIIGIYALLNR